MFISTNSMPMSLSPNVYYKKLGISFATCHSEINITSFAAFGTFSAQYGPSTWSSSKAVWYRGPIGGPLTNETRTSNKGYEMSVSGKGGQTEIIERRPFGRREG